MLNGLPQLPPRFDIISAQRIISSNYVTIVDKVTGVTYVCVSHGVDAATIIQPLLDKDGKPYVDPRYIGK